MVTIYPEVGRNVLVIEWSGRPTTAHVAAAEQMLLAALPRLRVPFDIISDIRALESLDAIEEADFVRVVSAALGRGQVRRVVRVVGRSKTAAIQIEKLSRLVNHSAHLAFSREEADALLSQTR